MTQTFQDKIRNKSYNQVLDTIAEYLSMISRKLFVDIAYKKKSRKVLKKEYIREYDILARQFNSIYSQVQGLIDSRLALLEVKITDKLLRIDNLTYKISSLEEEVLGLSHFLNSTNQKHPDFRKTVSEKKKKKSKIHHKKRKRQAFLHQLTRLEEDLRDKRPRVCFGTKKLFSKQFKGVNHEAWLKEWRLSRSHMFFLIGSKDERHGNQNCQFDGKSIRLRIPPKIQKDLGIRDILIEDIDFNYGHDIICKCACHYGYKLNKSYREEKVYQSISYRFIRKLGTWYIHASVQVERPKEITSPYVGALGVDFNVNHVNIYHIDRYGNPIEHQTLKYEIYSKSTNQLTDLLEQVAGQITDFAIENGLMVVIEALDFKDKKLFLKRKSKKYRRMLSNFPYMKYTNIMKTKCYKRGVALCMVNPRNTSKKGKKVIKRLGCSSHDGAAYIIGRSGLGYK